MKEIFDQDDLEVVALMFGKGSPLYQRMITANMMAKEFAELRYRMEGLDK